MLEIKYKYCQKAAFFNSIARIKDELIGETQNLIKKIKNKYWAISPDILHSSPNNNVKIYGDII